MSKQELNDCLKSFYTSARKQDGSYYKTSSMKSIRAAIDRIGFFALHRTAGSSQSSVTPLLQKPTKFLMPSWKTSERRER